jgi:hypothetical protein
LYHHGLSLRAPIAVAVEIRAGARRVFRLAENLGEDGITLVRPAPFEAGRPVEARFVLPDAGEPLALRAELLPIDGDEQAAADGDGGRALRFLDPPQDARAALRRYVQERLGLPA